MDDIVQLFFAGWSYIQSQESTRYQHNSRFWAKALRFLLSDEVLIDFTLFYFRPRTLRLSKLLSEEISITRIVGALGSVTSQRELVSNNVT